MKKFSAVLLAAIVVLAGVVVPTTAASAATLNSITPNTGTVAGGTSVTIATTGLVGTSATVTVGGAAATSIVANPTAQTITFVTPARSAGAQTVSVTNNSVTTTTTFTYANPFVTTGTPTISGVAKVGTTLTASPGTWNPNDGTYSYAWYRSGTTLVGSASTYVPVTADIGFPLTVRVTSTKTSYLTTTAISAATANVAASDLTATPTPTITGTLKVGNVLTANAGTWSPAPVTLAYQWLANGTAITNATNSTYTLTGAEATKAITVTVTGTKANYTTVAKTSTATAAIAAGDLTPTPVPTITGTVQVGKVLTAVPGTWGPVATTFTYQWKRAGVDIAGATAATYTVAAADIDKAITVAVTGSAVGYTSATQTSLPTSAAIEGVFEGTPTISGTLSVGNILSAVTAWSSIPGVTLTYQWRSANVPLSGKTLPTYTLIPNDYNKIVTVVISASAPGYASISDVVSTPTTAIAKGSFVSPTVTITGTAKVGTVLTANKGTWTPTPSAFTYVWKRNGVAISGATAATYTAAAADLGQAITVEITGSLVGYTTTTKVSAATSNVVVGTFTAPVPTITGTTKVGNILQANRGTWAPTTGATFAYQWYRNGVAISGATGTSYKLVSADTAAVITVTVTGTKTAYTTVTKTSAATSAIIGGAVAAGTVTVTGSRVVGQVLTANYASWTPTGLTYTYQWKRNGVAISGATAKTYTLVNADAASAVTVTVTGSRLGYTPASRTSTSAGNITGGSMVAGTVTISGAAVVGTTLTAAASGWTPTGLTYKYVWKRGSTVIAGVTTSTYKVVSADAGQTISVTITGSRTGFTSVSKSSSPTAAVVGALTVGTVSVTGSKTVGQTLTASPTGWAPSGLTYTYQWLRNGSAISGATAKTYKLVNADAGQSITVTATGSKTGYASAPKTSTAVTITGGTITTAVPTISGTPAVGQTLTAATSGWAPTPLTYTYQWKKNSVSISGATNSTYVPVNADAGSTITVTVTASKTGFTAASRTSVATAVITGGTITAGTVVASGTRKVGFTLTASLSGWTPTGLSYTYQWSRGGVAIAEATSSAYTLTEADAGSTITVTVVASKTAFNPLTKTSAPSAVITGGTLTAGAVTIAETSTIGTVLTATVAPWSPSGVAFTYQWQRDGVAIEGMTSSTYTVDAADAGHDVSVVVTGTKLGFTTISSTSNDSAVDAPA